MKKINKNSKWQNLQCVFQGVVVTEFPKKKNFNNKIANLIIGFGSLPKNIKGGHNF